MAIRIITNNVPRNFIFGSELSDSEKADFDWIDNIETQNFFRYLGITYSLEEFMTVKDGDELAGLGWHGICGQTAFSATIVKVADDGESLICGRILA